MPCSLLDIKAFSTVKLYSLSRLLFEVIFIELKRESSHEAMIGYLKSGARQKIEISRANSLAEAVVI